MSRIELTDSTTDALVKMAEGNPGAIHAMMAILEHHDSIDPQAMMGGLGSILLLDTWEIYGTNIYVLFNDKCNRDVRKFLLLERACQLGHLPQSKLKTMAADQMRQINLSDEEWQEIDNFVCGKLGDFQRPAEKEAVC